MSKITRRDFINGTLMAAGASMLSTSTSAQTVLDTLDPSYYPPARTGLRGNHPSSNIHAHSQALSGQTDWGPTTDLDETYDLIVVGGGISGLAAAYFYRQEHGHDKKILILDNHDDFGGHAKRNEHTIDGHLLLGYGGSQTLQEPHGYNKRVRKLLDDLGVDLEKFETSSYDSGFYKRHGLGAATYFNKKAFGEDKVVNHPFCTYPGYLEGLLRPTLSFEDAVQQTPLSERGKEQLLRVLHGGMHTLDVPQENLRRYMRRNSYFDYLKNDMGVDDPGVLRMARYSSLDNAGGGADILSLGTAEYSGAIGLDPVVEQKHRLSEAEYKEYLKDIGDTYVEEDRYIHHFPDGNATIARTLVKKMVPNVGEGETTEEIVLSKFDYSELDKSNNIVRIRLNSTVVKAQHEGDPNTSKEVLVDYVRDNQTYRVKGKGVVMACYNSMIPYIVPDLPPKQDAALRELTKIPLQYTTVGLTNWRAFKEAGIGAAMAPGNIHQFVAMDFPVSIGGYEYTKTPDEPCIVQLIATPAGSTVGAPAIEQFREARYKMLTMQFSDYEKDIRELLSGMLPKDSFDFDRDVESITLNRWAHGYSWGDPGEVGRKPFGRITIANADAVDNSMAEVAIQQGWRAVKELG